MTREWIDKHTKRWCEGHCKRLLKNFQRDIFPWLGAKAIADISAQEVLSVLRRIEARGYGETAHRTLGHCGQVFRYAVATGRVERDPIPDLRGALAPVQEGHLAAITEPSKVAEFLRIISDYQGSLPVSCALRLAPLVFVRPGELRRMEWADIDFEAAEWRFTATKTKTPHIVPLATQSIKILREV